jgi:putrescine transport system ATP-binding protein
VRCADCTHWVGHGITGTEGMAVSVAVRPEKIQLSREAPTVRHAPHNRVKGTIKDLSYFGSFTTYHLALPSGQVIKVNHSNVERHHHEALTWGDEAWASWTPSSQVVLTQ